MELKKIRVMSLAKITLLFGLLYGIISGIASAVAYAKGDVLAAAGQQIPAIITTLGYWSLLVMPILNAIIYFLAGLIGAILYNLFASWVGGVNLEFSEPKPRKK